MKVPSRFTLSLSLIAILVVPSMAQNFGSQGNTNLSTNSSVIVSGQTNTITNALTGAFIGAGRSNSIGARGNFSFIGGGLNNRDAGMTAASKVGVIVGGEGNVLDTNAQHAVIVGGLRNFVGVLSRRAFIGAGQDNLVSANTTNAVVVGGNGNLVASGATAAFIGGGSFNEVRAPGGVVPGGFANEAAGTNSFAAGSQAVASNTGTFVWADMSATNDFISTTANQFLIRAAGGVGINTNNPGSNALFVNGNVRVTGQIVSGSNTVSGTGAAVGGGLQNSASGSSATIGGGQRNSASGFISTVGGGEDNNNSSAHSVIAGGRANSLQSSFESVLSGGFENVITDAGVSTLAGGFQNAITDARSAFIGGGERNRVLQDTNSTIGGGLSNLIVNGRGSFIGGGVLNSVFSVTGGGREFCTIGGGSENTASGTNVTIGGGRNNAATNSFTTIGGGIRNRAGGSQATIGGGNGNIASGTTATVGGGFQNTNSGEGATIGGGFQNTNSGAGATIGGGEGNTAAGRHATIPGGFRNAATTDSFAAGTRAKATNVGAFVWADSGSADFSSAGINTFNLRASGGVFIRGDNTSGRLAIFPNVSDQSSQIFLGENNTRTLGMILRYAGNEANNPLHFIGFTNNVESPPIMTVSRNNSGRVGVRQPNPTAIFQVVNATCDGSTWQNASDRNLKTSFEPIDGAAILRKVEQLPISEWAYKSSAGGARHIGPTAQDFKAIFGLGESDRTISTIDPSGVALAAIKGLAAEVRLRDEKIAALEAKGAAQAAGSKAEIEELKAELRALRDEVLSALPPPR